MEVDNDSSRIAEVERSELIVVSSLVDKPPNLGGICRLCDVLGAGLLTLHDIEVKKHPHFKTVAVTADHWMPMIEVKMENIRDYLLDKKREGYTLIGLEQTDKSVELNNDLKFPKKSLILIGKEREGIPGDLLAELDFCVEIKQVGIVRSMNIQTATAIIVHAYSSQHC
ncbi:tRNA (guanosine(18)-2'-O)-methyltransferase [Candida tropicalis]